MSSFASVFVKLLTFVMLVKFAPNVETNPIDKLCGRDHQQDSDVSSADLGTSNSDKSGAAEFILGQKKDVAINIPF